MQTTLSTLTRKDDSKRHGQYKLLDQYWVLSWTAEHNEVILSQVGTGDCAFKLIFNDEVPMNYMIVYKKYFHLEMMFIFTQLMIINEMNDLKDLASTVSFYTFCYLALFRKQRTKSVHLLVFIVTRLRLPL